VEAGTRAFAKCLDFRGLMKLDLLTQRPSKGTRVQGSVLELWKVSGTDLPGLDVLVVASCFYLPLLAA
jgi:hypothetical protein